jgi:hypothetical protein
LISSTILSKGQKLVKDVEDATQSPTGTPGRPEVPPKPAIEEEEEDAPEHQQAAKENLDLTAQLAAG